MLAHHLKAVLTIVPEAMGFIKEASVELDFPTNSKDSTAASYLTAQYLIKSAGKVLDTSLLAKLEKAANLYGIKTKLDGFVHRFTVMEKKSSEEETRGMVKQAQSMFEGELCGFLNIIDAANTAETLLEKFAGYITSEEVKRYAGHAWLNKEAAMYSLANRYLATNKSIPAFIKIAKLIEDSNMRSDDFAEIKEITKAVAYLDKQAGLDLRGFNPYKEFLMTKKAAVESATSVKLNGQEVPYLKIAKLGKDSIGNFLGKDVSAAMTGDVCNDKAVLEALPRDLQIQLLQALKNV